MASQARWADARDSAAQPLPKSSVGMPLEMGGLCASVRVIVSLRQKLSCLLVVESAD